MADESEFLDFWAEANVELLYQMYHPIHLVAILFTDLRLPDTEKQVDS